VFAFSVNTFVGSAVILIITVHWSMFASLSMNTAINSARILVVTQGLRCGVHATNMFIASINGASNFIITFLWSNNTT
jgi:hypothetical protein